MITWRDQHQRIRIFLLQPKSSCQNGRCSIAAFRLDQYGRRVKTDIQQLLGHNEPEIRIGQDERLAVPVTSQSKRRRLKHRLVTNQ